MDWKQFFASVIGSLAWPTVVVVLLLVLRRQVTRLASRLLKLTLPGGVEASFSEELEKSAEKVAEVVADQPVLPPPEPDANPQARELLERYPALSVISSFKNVENILAKIGARLFDRDNPMSRKMKWNQALLVGRLLSLKLIDQTVVDLYNRLRHMRNIAAHGDHNEISAVQAIEYADQARVLTHALEKAYEQLDAAFSANSTEGSF